MPLACAGPVVRVDGPVQPVYRHRDLAYEIAPPGGGEIQWSQVDVEGADLAFRAEASEPAATLSLLSRCGEPAIDAGILARHLLIGIGERRVAEARPDEVDGIPAWFQVFETRDAEVMGVRVRAVTARADDCVFDWLLVTAGEDPAADSAFDAWVGTFRLRPGGPAQLSERRAPDGSP